MKKALILVIAALALPSVALAAKPAHSNVSAPKVAYILTGTLSAYTAYDKATSTNGSVTILVKASNYHGKALHNQSLTFVVGAKTWVTLHNHKPIKDGDRGMVTVRAALKVAPADLAATLQAAPAKHVIDMGAPRAPKS
jgi:hypothetical protein